MDKDFVTGLVFTSMGIITLICSFVWLRRIVQLRRKATTQTTATVTNETYGEAYRPNYTFYVDNLRYDVCSQQASSPPLCKDGELVTLYFVPENPRAIYVPKEKRRLYLAWVLAFFAGVLFTSIGIAMLFGLIKGT